MNIFLFHRDLRLVDNTALIRQLKKHKQVTPIFIFHDPQINPKKNQYFSHNSAQFMVECLEQLTRDIERLKGKFYMFHGDNIDVLKAIHKFHKIGSIYYNYDYTPFAKKRDQEIQKWGESQNIEVKSYEDYVLYPILQGKTVSPNSGKPYLVFTPFKNYCLNNLKVDKPDPFEFKEGDFQLIKDLQNLPCRKVNKDMYDFFEGNDDIVVRGGRQNGLKILSSIKNFKNYNKDRNNPSIPSTRLGAYLHFTPISIRETYEAALRDLGPDNNIINELHWRDFYVNITHYHPKVLQQPQPNYSFQQKFDLVQWKYNPKYLEAWKKGQTGFPIVDAAMRELNTTGYMHNRCRMIVASFLAKDLFLDWHEGEKYFASKLVDYSPMQNSGGWQWTVGNGTDAQPYFRIFNPWSQQANYDPECVYIKRWVPELRFIPNEDIHKWNLTCQKYIKSGAKYPAPMIDHAQARNETLAIYEKYFKKKEKAQ